MLQSANLHRLTNTQLCQLAEKSPRNADLLGAILKALQSRTSLTGEGARARVSDLLAKAERRSSKGYWAIATAAAAFLAIGMGQAAGESIWEAVWPRVQGLFAG